jgi:hypothetical protein
MSSSNEFEVNYSLFANTEQFTTDAQEIEEINSDGCFTNGDWICLGSYNSIFMQSSDYNRGSTTYGLFSTG